MATRRVELRIDEARFAVIEAWWIASKLTQSEAIRLLVEIGFNKLSTLEEVTWRSGWEEGARDGFMTVQAAVFTAVGEVGKRGPAAGHKAKQREAAHAERAAVIKAIGDDTP